MVDEERVTRLASEVVRDVTRLRHLGKTERLVSQVDQLDAVKYRFLTAIEGCIGIAHHLVDPPLDVFAALTGVAANPVRTPFERPDHPILADRGESMFPVVKETRDHKRDP